MFLFSYIENEAAFTASPFMTASDVNHTLKSNIEKSVQHAIPKDGNKKTKVKLMSDKMSLKNVGVRRTVLAMPCQFLKVNFLSVDLMNPEYALFYLLLFVI